MLWRILSLVLALVAQSSAAPPEFTKDFTEIAIWSGRLAEQVDNPYNNTESWDSLQFWRKEPDAVLLGRKFGLCFLTFQATVDGPADFFQLVAPGLREFCTLDDPNACCEVRTGTWNAFYADYMNDALAAVDECVQECEDPDTCLILSGISQGASVAAMAGAVLRKYDPWVFQFGLLPALFPDCNIFNPDKYVVFINSGICQALWFRFLVYDFPWTIRSRGEVNRGWVFIVGEDPSGIVNLGLDAQEFEREWWPLVVMGFSAHALRDERSFCPRIDGYIERLEASKVYYDAKIGGIDYPVRQTGYNSNTYCSLDDECNFGDCILNDSLVKPGRCE